MSFESKVDELSFVTDGITPSFGLSNENGALYFMQSGDIHAAYTPAGGNPSLLQNGLNFAVTGDGRLGQGTLTPTAPLAAGKLRIWCETSAIQPEEYEENDGFPAKTHERAQDRHAMEVRDVLRIVKRGIQLAPESAPINVYLPLLKGNGSQVLALNATEDAFTFQDPMVDQAEAAAAAAIAAAGAAIGQAYLFVNTIANFRTITAAAAAVTPNAFLRTYAGTLNDGAAGTFVWNAADARADDGATIINPTGNGGAGRWNRIITDHISVNWWNPPINLTGDVGPALRSAIAAAVVWKVREIRSFGQLKFTTQICSAAFGWELPGGLTFRGVGQQIAQGGGPGTDNAMWFYNGTAGTDMFDIRAADGLFGAAATSNILFQDLRVITGVNNGFVSVNLLRQGGADFVAGVGTFPNFVQSMKFKNIKASGNFGRWFFLGRNCFETTIDDDCHIQNFFRGVQLTGSDDSVINGRYEGNASRHIMLQKDGTYGNQNVVSPNFLGEIGGADVSENHYAIYDSSEGATLQNLYIEADGANCYAGLFLGGSVTTITNPHIFSSGANPLRLFHLGPSAANITMINPDTATAGSCLAPQIDAATILLYTATGHDDYFIRIINPSANFTSKVSKAQRCRVLMGSIKLGAYSGAYLPVMGLSANGPGIRRYSIHAQNPGNASPLTGVGVSAIAADVALKNYAGQALQIAAVNGDGLYMEFTIGNDFQIGDSVTFKALCRCSAVPASGNLRVSFFKNGVETGAPKTTALGIHSILTDTVDTSGYANGDTLRVVAKNAALVGANGLIGMIEVINNS